MTDSSELTTNKAILLAAQAKQASLVLGAVSLSARNQALQTIHSHLRDHKSDILAANQLDMTSASELVAQGKLQASMVKRLDLAREGKFESMLQGILDIMDLPDPLGRVTYATRMDTALELRKVSCALGVLLVIFEARPEVVVNITALALKSGISSLLNHPFLRPSPLVNPLYPRRRPSSFHDSGTNWLSGNAAILKGGKESIHTTSLLVRLITEALSSTAIPPESIAYLTSREEVTSLLSQTHSIDLVIPRGSNALVSSIQNSTRIPVMGHADGRCCVYVHNDADLSMASYVIEDSKVDYPAACNAVETLLVHEDLIKNGKVREVIKGLVDRGVEMRCEEDVLTALDGVKGTVRATDEDIVTEFLDLQIYVKSVKDLDEGTPVLVDVCWFSDSSY
jgi:glutamate-5-semialdehyde dehydrogenase